jgi:3-oxoadipate enol-lactonase
MEKIEISNEIEIAYHVSEKENAPKMVLIHDLFLNSNVWNYQLSHFKKNFSILTYDLRGHGQSTKPTKGFTLRDHADDLTILLSRLNWQEEIYLIGHSLGGMIAMVYALENFEKVKRLVLSNSFCDVSQESIENLLERINFNSLEEFCKIIIDRGLIPYRKENAKIIQKAILNDMRKEDCISTAAAYSGFRICDHLKKLKVPTLIIASEKDIIMPVWASEMMHGWIKNSNLVIISDAGHHVNLNHSEEFNDLLLKFWNEEMDLI